MSYCIANSLVATFSLVLGSQVQAQALAAAVPANIQVPPGINAFLKGRAVGRPYTPLRFVTPGPYRMVRHPLYVGWLLAFWMTPTMTLSHLLFAVMTTAYILVAIRFEERDLLREFPRDYANYREQVPMIVPYSRRDVPAANAPVAHGEAS